MKKCIKPLLICPHCHGSLDWRITKETDTHIVDANIECHHCGHSYFIRDEVACFLIREPGDEDLWEENSQWVDTFLNKQPEVATAILEADLNNLNGADLLIRSTLMHHNHNLEEAYRLWQLGYYKCHDREEMSAVDKQHSNVCAYLKDKEGIVLDFATGKGYLAEKIAASTSLTLIESDISFRVMFENRQRDRDEAISYMAFDARAIPFGNRTIPYVTNNMGLQNIRDPLFALHELKRICSGQVIGVYMFFLENDDRHRKLLEEYRLDQSIFKVPFMRLFQEIGFHLEAEYGITVPSSPTPMSQYVENFTVDRFPAYETEAEYCTCIFSV